MVTHNGCYICSLVCNLISIMGKFYCGRIEKDFILLLFVVRSLNFGKWFFRKKEEKEMLANKKDAFITKTIFPEEIQENLAEIKYLYIFWYYSVLTQNIFYFSCIFLLMWFYRKLFSVWQKIYEIYIYIWSRSCNLSISSWLVDIFSSF